MSMQYERRWLAVVALGLSLFLSALDATIVALALPPIAQHFQLSDSLASAVTLSYAIPLPVLILPAGDLVSRFRTLPPSLISVAGLLRGPLFLWGLLAFFCSVTVAGALYYLLPFDLSAVQRIAPAHAGVILLCVPLGMGVMGILSGYLTDRYGARLFILTGSGL